MSDKTAEKGNEFGIQVCKALGVDPALVQSVTVEAKANEVLAVNLVLIPRLSRVAEINDMLRVLAELPKVVNVSWSRPVLDATSLTSIAREWDSE